MKPVQTSSIMPRTTLDLDASVLAELRRRSKEERKSMGQLASEVLTVGLDPGAGEEAPPLRWTRRRMGPFKVDLEDKEAIGRLLDAEDRERGGG
jgi:hypothetical protein